MNPITDQVLNIPTARIRPDPTQPRKEFDPAYIESLGASIEAEGLLQPITVRVDPEKHDGYIIVAGECRWRAHAFKRLQTVRCLVTESHENAARRFRAQTLENMGRKKMTLKEEAFAVERMVSELGDTVEVVAKAIGSTKYHVTNLRKMTKMSDVCWRLIEGGQIQPWLVEKTVAVVDEDAVEGIMLRCVGKNCKQSSAILAAYVDEQKQAGFELAMEESGAAARKADLLMGLTRQFLEVAETIKSLTHGDQMNLARVLGNELTQSVPATAESRKTANFMRQVFNQIDAVIEVNKK